MISINYFPRVKEVIIIDLIICYNYLIKFNDNLEVQFSINLN